MSLREAAQQALDALENPWAAKPEGIALVITALRAALEPVTDYHGLEQARAVVISNLLAHFGITSADSDVNVAYLHKQLNDFLTASICCNKGVGEFPFPSKIEKCEYPWCLSPGGCGKQCPAFPRNQSATTGETSDVPETNFGNMAQAVYSKEAETTSQEPQQVEPVAWLSQGGDVSRSRRYFEEMGFTDLIPLHMAPPKREPLTEESLENLFLGNDSNDWWRLELKEFVKVARAIERAHGIGGEE